MAPPMPQAEIGAIITAIDLGPNKDNRLEGEPQVSINAIPLGRRGQVTHKSDVNAPPRRSLLPVPDEAAE